MPRCSVARHSKALVSVLLGASVYPEHGDCQSGGFLRQAAKSRIWSGLEDLADGVSGRLVGLSQKSTGPFTLGVYSALKFAVLREVAQKKGPIGGSQRYCCKGDLS